MARSVPAGPCSGTARARELLSGAARRGASRDIRALWSDPAFWGERPPDAGYVHAIAVRRAYAGRELGKRLLDWAEGRATESGREYLRLDCMTDNENLRAYYERLGFEPRGETRIDDFTATLFERRCRR